jgi:hypothetical protein
MKPTAVLALSCLLLTSDAVVHAQEFQNLDFEQAMPDLPGPPGDDRYRYAANVLPHWLVNEGFPEWWGDAVAYNTYGHIGTEPLVHVFGGDGVSTDEPPSPNQYRAVAGDYSAALDPRQGGASLQQTAMIPAGARSLRFSGTIVEWPFSDWAYGDVDVSLNSVSLPIRELGPVVGATYRQGLGGEGQVFQYGVNIPPGLAGTTATLKFYAEGGSGLSAFLVLDNIQFSPVAIPEPATLALASIGTFALTAIGRRSKAPRA